MIKSDIANTLVDLVDGRDFDTLFDFLVEYEPSFALETEVFGTISTTKLAIGDDLFGTDAFVVDGVVIVEITDGALEGRSSNRNANL